MKERILVLLIFCSLLGVSYCGKCDPHNPKCEPGRVVYLEMDVDNHGKFYTQKKSF